MTDWRTGTGSWVLAVFHYESGPEGFLDASVLELPNAIEQSNLHS